MMNIDIDETGGRRKQAHNTKRLPTLESHERRNPSAAHDEGTTAFSVKETVLEWHVGNLIPAMTHTHNTLALSADQLNSSRSRLQLPNVSFRRTRRLFAVSRLYSLSRLFIEAPIHMYLNTCMHTCNPNLVNGCM